MNIEKVKTSVIFNQTAKSADGLTRLYYHKRVRRSDGSERVFSGADIVKDENLLKRLNKLKKGTEIEIETETHWGEKGIPAYLIDFSCKKSPENSSPPENFSRKKSGNPDRSKAKFVSKQEKSNEDEICFI